MLPVLWALIAAVLAYQAPFQTRLEVGSLGDRFFLQSSQAQDQQQDRLGRWHVDQLDPQGRSRWSRSQGTLSLPGVGQGRDLSLTLFVGGWPADVVRAEPQQPDVAVLVGQQAIDRLTPTSDAIAPFALTIPAALQSGPDLALTLRSSATFTSTATYADGRSKGIRLDAISIASRGWGVWPDWRVVGGLGLATALAMASATASGGPVAAERRRRLTLLLGVGVALLGASGLLVARLWLAALLPWVLLGLATLLALLHWRWWRRLWHGLRWRMAGSPALEYGLVAALVLLCGYLVLRLLPAGSASLLDTAGDPFAGQGADRYLRTLAQLSLLSGVALTLVVSVTLLPSWVLQLRRRLITGRLAAVLLALLAGIWLGYMTWLIRTLPFVGHADYADNAVVARNLLRGRGWVVDYVSQFYDLVPGATVTRPQETWPLLQPLLMLPFFAVWGPTPFAARVPNLLFLVALTVLLYHVGARVWDRRVGLLAALLTLTNLFFFRLAIFATSDLALVVWSMAAFWLVFQGVENQEPGTRNQTGGLSIGAQRLGRRQAGAGVSLGARRSILSAQRLGLGARRSALGSSWLWAGVFCGLMILQKPSAAIIVLGMGLWALWHSLDRAPGERPRQRLTLREWLRRRLPSLALWVVITVLVVAPYIVRNLRVFSAPFFSTETYDAWVLYFRGTGDEAWEDIYKVYAPELTDVGRPDRSWVLRWGYDLTLGKLSTQARDAWDFFAPPKGKLLGYDVDGIAATWLLLLGLLALRPRQRRLVALVALPLLIYTVFLIVYWHTHEEQRYFVAFIPWMALVAAGGACWLFDRIAAIGRGRWAGLAGLALSAALISAVQPHWREIDAELDPQNPRYWGVDWAAELEAYAWIERNTPPDAVIMTRAPWQLNYHADRAAVMIPNAGWDQIMQIARYYGADYLVTNNFTTSLPESRGDLKPLASGTALPGWTLVQSFADRYNGAPVRIYRIPADYAGVAPLAEPPAPQQ